MRASLKGKCEGRNWSELLLKVKFTINATFGRKVKLHAMLRNKLGIRKTRKCSKMKLVESDQSNETF